MGLESRNRDMQDARTLVEFFTMMDVDGSKSVSHDEFLAVFEEPKFLAFLHARGLDISDVDGLWDILRTAAGEEEFDIDMLVGSILRMKGLATAVDALTVRHELRMVA